LDLKINGQNILKMRTVTMAFDPIEDRICMDAADFSGRVEKLWLSRRLLDRLVPALTKQLEQLDEPESESNSRAEIQSFAQEKAIVEKKEHSPIKGSSESKFWLVTSIQVGQKNNDFQLRFINEIEEAGQKFVKHKGVFTLAKPNLRQWLNAVFKIYQKAEWKTDSFPNWMDDTNSIGKSSITLN